MDIVVVGYGRVGIRAAQLLAEEGHEVTVVDDDPEKIERAADDGFRAVEGSGDDERVLEDAGIGSADAVGALTGEVNVNFAACMIAKEVDDCRTVLRIDEDYREEIYDRYAADVDEIIYPERLGAAAAKNALLGGNLNVVGDLAEEFTLATIEVPEDSPLVGRRVVAVDFPGEARIYAHGRLHEPMDIPLPRTEIRVGDRLAVLADPTALDDVRARVRSEAEA
jgi:trk system potassium uptake protein TrkA